MKVEQYWHETIKNYRYDGDVSVDVTCSDDASRRERRPRRHHRPPRPQSGTIFTGSHVVPISRLARTERNLAMKTYGAVEKPVEDLRPPHPGPITHRRPAIAEPRRIWPGRQIHGHRRCPSHSGESHRRILPALGSLAVAAQPGRRRGCRVKTPHEVPQP